MPDLDAIEGEFFGFHECGADLVALIAVLHFDSVVDHLLETTQRQSLYLQRAEPLRRAVAEHSRSGSPATSTRCRTFADGLDAMSTTCRSR